MNQSGSSRLPALARFVALAILASAPVAMSAGGESSRKPPAQWVTLSGCRFMPEETSDGDSFHVKYGQIERIFRLYFVDAPETDTGLKDRVREQCEYFGVTPKEIKQAAEAAKKFTIGQLKRPFTVRTRWQNAGGRSRLPRYFAQIEVRGVDLGEELVRHGLARAKGVLAILPDGTKAKDHMARLRRIESEAKARRAGIWAYAKATAPEVTAPSTSSR